MNDLIVWLERFPLSTFVGTSQSVWGYPMFLFVHTLGMSIVAGGAVIVGFALLGCWPAASVKPLVRLWPIIWVAFWINLFTGIGLFLSDLRVKGSNPVFWAKMALVVLGLVAFGRIRKVLMAPDADQQAPKARGLAWALLACWFGAIVTGRLLAYVGTGH